MEQVNALVAVKQFIPREGLASILKDLKIVKTIRKAATGDDLGVLLGDATYDLLVIDSNLIDGSIVGIVVESLRNAPGMNVLVVTSGLEYEEIAQFNAAGLHNIILSDCDEDDFRVAVDATLKGKMFYSSEILEKLIQVKEPPVAKTSVCLTPSEVEIVKLIAYGCTTKLIADKKNISFHTVVTHRKNIFKKMGVNSSSELIRQALKLNLLDNIEYYI